MIWIAAWFAFCGWIALAATIGGERGSRGFVRDTLSAGAIIVLLPLIVLFVTFSRGRR